ncbi:MAG: Na(+)-translocating NADH-quinone reductase subunit A [Lentisphaeraceae bacterium]|nr:Na(+)-translocating NADH-quinone reductase subunit A [Lentisphaeraceae bacterium]
MATYSLKKGYNLRITGEPESVVEDAPKPDSVAVDARDFFGVRPKLTVKVGDKVKAGSPVMMSKDCNDVKFTSPISGEVVEIRRGERRALQEIVIKGDGTDAAEEFPVISSGDILTSTRETILNNILKSGLFVSFQQRPFAIVPNPTVTPRDIFISAYLTGPLHADINLILKGNEAAFQAGLNALSKLTDGDVYLSHESGKSDLSEAITKAANVKINTFKGPHPAGNVGIHVHHIKPVNKGEVVWTVTPQNVINIGKLFIEGKPNFERVVAVCGESAKDRKHIKTIAGAPLQTILKGKVADGEVRHICGDVLSGSKKEADGFLAWETNQISLIPEIQKKEFMGWLLPGPSKESFSRTFWSWLSPNKKYSHNTGYHGGVRAFVATGEYEAVVPMDIFPVHLIKCIMFGDIEAMEGLGILEVAPEDFALCDFICVSKIEVQETLRQGLDLYRKEG